MRFDSIRSEQDFGEGDGDSLSVFQLALGRAFHELPLPIQRFHDNRQHKTFEGRASIRRSFGLIPNLVAWLFKLPLAGHDVPTTVTVERLEGGERWTRTMGRSVFVSHVTADPKTSGVITETLGPVHFDIPLDCRLGRLYFPVSRARIGWFTLPWLLTPRSDTIEHLTFGDKFYFSVQIELPIIGHLISYDGWLEESAPFAGAAPQD